MKAVVILRKEVPEASLLIDVFSEEGRRQRLKIPGILKSKKRNAFYMAPLTIWDFTIVGNPRNIMTPKEYTLVTAPFDFDVAYDTLLQLAKLALPLRYLREELALPELYDELEAAVSAWRPALAPQILNRFYLRFMEAMGLLHYSAVCSQCGTSLSANADYYLSAGSICHDCLKAAHYSPREIVANSWVGRYLNADYCEGISAAPETASDAKAGAECREKIMAYIETQL